MEAQPDVAAVAALIADRSRARMLLELLDGAARPVTRLAQIAGISTSTASEHLSKLARAGLVCVHREGRTRRYQLAGVEVAIALEALVPLAPSSAPTGLREVTQWDRLRVARSCYDHLAGALGTDIMAGLVDRDALRRTDGIAGTVRGPHDRTAGPTNGLSYALGPLASEVFGALDVDPAALQNQRRPLIRVCTDWTEQRHHLAGGLGAAIRQAMIDRHWIEPRPGRRDIRVHRPEAIHAWLNSA